MLNNGKYIKMNRLFMMDFAGFVVGADKPEAIPWRRIAG
jgi:hypothetical protein